MTESTLETRVEGKVGILTFERPKVLNAFKSVIIGEIGRAMAAFSADPAIHAIIVNGNGRAFSQCAT